MALQEIELKQKSFLWFFYVEHSGGGKINPKEIHFMLYNPILHLFRWDDILKWSECMLKLNGQYNAGAYITNKTVFKTCKPV